MTLDDILESGRRRAEQLLGRVIDIALAVPGPLRSLKDMLESTSAAERELMELGDRIKALDAIGYATAADFYGYNVTRRNITSLQRKLLTGARDAFFDRPEVLSRLPRTVADWPALVPTRGTFYEPSGAPAQGGLGRLGAAPLVAAAPAAAMAPWMICAIILAILATMAVVGYAAATSMGVTVESISNIFVVREQIRGLRITVEARMEVYNDCVARAGNSPTAAAECARLAVATIPTPADAAVPYPEPGAWIKWVAIGLGIVALAGFGGYFLYKRSSVGRPQLSGTRKSSKRGGTRGAAKFKPISARRFPYENANDQGLPV
jgi:hypothetical protein